MNRRMRIRWILGVAGFAALVLIAWSQRSTAFSPPDTKPCLAELEGPKEDRDAIAAAVKTFTEAFIKGDAKALAAHWTENGEYMSDDGETFRGRAAIEKEYAEAFSKRKSQPKVEIEIDTIRFPSKDTAIEEGHFRVGFGKQLPQLSKYTVLHVREGGKWLMAVVREWPTAGASLRDLDWLIGSWKAERDGNEVRTDYEWWQGKNFIRVQFHIKTKEGTSKGFQMIGVDASAGTLRSWTFDPDGSFGEATWSRDGKKWMQDTTSVDASGRTVTAVNMFTPMDKDTFVFQATNRTIDGEEMPDIAPVRVRRTETKTAATEKGATP